MLRQNRYRVSSAWGILSLGNPQPGVTSPSPPLGVEGGVEEEKEEEEGKEREEEEEEEWDTSI